MYTCTHSRNAAQPCLHEAIGRWFAAARYRRTIVASR
jgi:hypothetical protein